VTEAHESDEKPGLSRHSPELAEGAAANPLGPDKSDSSDFFT